MCDCYYPFGILQGKGQKTTKSCLTKRIFFLLKRDPPIWKLRFISNVFAIEEDPGFSKDKRDNPPLDLWQTGEERSLFKKFFRLASGEKSHLSFPKNPLLETISMSVLRNPFFLLISQIPLSVSFALFTNSPFI